jgi:cytochrome c-type biogenesis protein CcmH/NrfG
MDKLAMLSQILAEHPADAFARYGLAMEYVAQNRIAEGLAAFDHCIADNPDYVPAYQMSAQTMAAHGQADGAVARLHAGIAAANRTSNQHALAEMEALREELTGIL